MLDSAGNNFKASSINIFFYLIENMVITIRNTYNLSRDKNLQKAKSRIWKHKNKKNSMNGLKITL